MRSVMSHNFSQIPSVQVPRSVFNRSHGHKTTFDAGYLVPIYVDEALPGDTFNMSATVMGRLITTICPVMDNLFIDTFFFAVPNRLVWKDWEAFIGGEDYLLPQTSITDAQNQSIFDYFGIPTNIADPLLVSALPFRSYNLIYNEWFRPQELIDEVEVKVNEGPDLSSYYSLLKRAKRHDYFTSALLEPQKGDAVTLPLGDTAPVIGNGYAMGFSNGTDYIVPYGNLNDARWEEVDPPAAKLVGTAVIPDQPSTSNIMMGLTADGTKSGIIADLSEATSATINSIREAFQLQKMLERDARGGTRYTEIIRSHFGVISEDARLQRPEYLGGSTQRITIKTVEQTSASSGDTPQGNLAGYGVVMDGNARFSKSFTEHCTIIGLACVRADLTYQQGLNRMWSRQTRYDFYWPSLAHLGEQEVLNKEIYADGSANDDLVFGYQERYAEYRYNPSKITGKMRSNDPLSLDIWHLSQDFDSCPTLGQTFIEETPPVGRVMAVEDEPHIKCDCFFDLKCVRPMPVYSIPGLVDHF